jgi:hypothetical protein
VESAARVGAVWPELAVTGLAAVVISWLYVALAGGENVNAPSDIDFFFRPAGEAILRGDLATPYADSQMQAGPGQLVLDVLLLGWNHGGEWAWSITRALVLWVFLLTFVLLSRPRGSTRVQRVASLVLVLVLVLVHQASEFYRWGHWWHLPVGLLMAWAAGTAASSRWVQTGVLLGVAMWFEPFAVVGLAVLMLSPGVWVALRAAVVAGVVGVLAYLPFVLAGSFAMGRRVLAVSPGTWAAVVWGSDTRIVVDFRLRVIQTLAAVAIAGLIIWLMRSSVPLPALALVAAATAVCARIALEPFWWPYYSIIPLCFLAAAGLRLAFLRRPAALPVAVATGAMAVLSPFAPPIGAAAALVVLALTGSSHWNRVWDRLAVDFAPMRRPLEPDFAAGNGTG